MGVHRSTGWRGVALGAALAVSGLPGAPGAAGGLVARPATAQEGPAEALFREGREALRAGRYLAAAETLSRLAEAYPTSARAGEALYWAAFALYRAGAMEDALRQLERLIREYPEVADRGDARALRVRVEGTLARGGDAEAAASVTALAAGAALESGEAIERRMAEARIAEAEARVAEAGARIAETGARIGARETELRTIRPPEGAVIQEACPEEEQEIQAAALSALLVMDADRALPVLERVMARRDECSIPLRRQATHLIGQKGGQRSGELLMDVVRNDPAMEVRAQGVYWLSRVEGERALGILEEILATSEEPELQEKALFALTQQSSERALEILESVAMDAARPEDIRSRAIFWLGQRGGFDDIERMKELYARLESPELKERVFLAFSQGAVHAGAVDWLLERALEEGEPVELRKRALFWAAQAGLDTERLDDLYRRTSEHEMKEQIVFIHGQRRTPESTEALIRIAREEPDRELRKRAIFWLGQSRDPRASEFLVELLESPGR